MNLHLIWANQEFPCKIHRQFTGSTTCLRNYPNFQTLRCGWICPAIVTDKPARTHPFLKDKPPGFSSKPPSVSSTQLDPWSYHWTLSLWSLDPMNKNDYVLMFLKQDDWEDDEDRSLFQVSKLLTMRCSQTVFVTLSTKLNCQTFLYMKTETC